MIFWEILELVQNLAARWRHLHQQEICPPGDAICISKKFGHQVAPHAQSYCLGFLYWHHQLVLVLYLHQSDSHQQWGSSTRVSLASLHQLDLHNIDNIDSLHQVFTRFQTKGLGQTLLPNDRTPCAHGSDKSHNGNDCHISLLLMKGNG